MIKTRFAPSPTGVLHIGSVRTALFNWLYARHCGGEFVLRIEDTDRQRSTQESVETILDGLSWLGLVTDQEPVFQSSRYERYREVAESLLNDGKAYRCICSKQRLDELREQQRAAGETSRYDGRCRTMAVDANAADFVVRFKSPLAGQVRFDDGVKGSVQYDNAELDDLIILRSDNTPTYNFTVVVDDSDMGISHVIRGDDHLNNTPRQINLYEAIGFKPPEFSHLPMILGEDGTKLSKRHGAMNVLDYREKGYLPEAMINYLVRLGWSHGDQEIFSLDEMVALFDITDVNKSASAFNASKLDWLNQQYLITANPADVVPLLKEQLASLGLDHESGPDLDDVIVTFRERADTIAGIADQSQFCFVDVPELDASAAKKHLRPVALELLEASRNALSDIDEWTSDSLANCIAQLAESHNVGLGKIGQPLRVAITGGGSSPGIGETLALVGRRRSLLRLDKALEFVKQRVAASA